MAFDGIFMHALTTELQDLLIGGRIDKIHQPEKDELAIYIRGREKNLTLFISIESALPYFTVTKLKKENPLAPPMFCMLMRKHLAGGRIYNLTQYNNERILIIEVEAKDELGEMEHKKLIIEIMGKHSNVILTREDFTIIESIKRITPDMSRVRSILPGLKYEFLESDKLMLVEAIAQTEELFETLAPQTKLFKALYSRIEGFSPLSSKIVCNMAGLDPEMPIVHLSDGDVQALKVQLENFRQLAEKKPITGTVYFDALEHPSELYFVNDLEGYDSQKNFDFLYEATDEFFNRQNRKLKNHQRANDLKKLLQQRLERAESKLGKLKSELTSAEHAEDYKIKGELILANIFTLSKGMNVATVLNYYDEAQAMIDISLDVRLEPSENAQKFFKKYNKLKTAVIELNRQIQETENDVAYLDQVLTILNNIDEPSELDSIRLELIEQGILKARYQKSIVKVKKEVYKVFMSSDGFEILVGKNNKQNDQLTTKLASNKDIWLHTKIIPGSHVIIKTNGANVPENTLVEAAIIAAYHSKARASSNVPVDYTHVKNVSKPNGAKPGMVIYDSYKTLYVTPNEEIVMQLKK